MPVTNCLGPNASPLRPRYVVRRGVGKSGLADPTRRLGVPLGLATIAVLLWTLARAILEGRRNER